MPITDDSNRTELLELMRQNGIKPESLPELTEYSASSVEAWMMKDRASARARPVPDRALSLFKVKLEAAKAKLNQ